MRWRRPSPLCESLDESLDFERSPRFDRERNQVAIDGTTIQGEPGHATGCALGLMNGDVERGASEPASHFEVAPVRGQDRVYAKAVVLGPDAEDPLADGHKVPCGGAAQPGVLGLAMGRSVLARDHLGIHVRLTAMDLGDLFTR